MKIRLPNLLHRKAYKKSAQAILAAKSIAIAAHINPDGDTIGSLLALGLALKKIGKQVYFISQDGVPRKYRFLPGARLIRRSLAKKVDLAIAVDCASSKQLKDSFKIFKSAKNILEIDHHEVRRSFGNIQLVDVSAAAVGEIIYRLVNMLGIEINSAIGTNMLISIIIETGFFHLPNTRWMTLHICSDLLKKGIDFSSIINSIFWNKSRNEILLSGITLSRTRFEQAGKLAWTYINKEDFRKVRGKDEDVDAVADELRAVSGVQAVVIFREKSKHVIRVSLRSKESINIAQLAESCGGAGHFDVAGCEIPNTVAAKKDLLRKVRLLLKKGR